MLAVTGQIPYNLSAIPFWQIIIICFHLIHSCHSELPCDFVDSINITAGTHNPSGSITHSGIEYSAELFSEVDYILKNGTERIRVPNHIRGCPCKSAQCIRLCCPYGSFVSDTESEYACQKFENNTWNLHSEILNKYNKTEHLNLDHHFAYVVGMCRMNYIADGDYQLTHVRNCKKLVY